MVRPPRDALLVEEPYFHQDMIGASAVMIYALRLNIGYLYIGNPAMRMHLLFPIWDFHDGVQITATEYLVAYYVSIISTRLVDTTYC